MPSCIKIIVLVRWEVSLCEWCKLNTDGASRSLFNHARGGGLLKDSNVLWLRGFAYNIGKCSALVTELKAMLVGQELAWRWILRWFTSCWILARA